MATTMVIARITAWKARRASWRSRPCASGRSRIFWRRCLLSQGVPMLLAGDECRRTQRGNNNAYCQDNQISWFDWSLVDKNADLVRFVKALIALRRSNPALRRRSFLSGIPTKQGELSDVSWFNALGRAVDWRGNDEQSLVCIFGAVSRPDRVNREPSEAIRLENGGEVSRNVMLLLNPCGQAREFAIPELVRTLRWRKFIDTAAAPPADIYPALDGPEPPLRGPILVPERTLICYVADK